MKTIECTCLVQRYLNAVRCYMETGNANDTATIKKEKVLERELTLLCGNVPMLPLGVTKVHYFTAIRKFSISPPQRQIMTLVVTMFLEIYPHVSFH